MPPTICVHCERVVPERVRYTYTQSGCVAHIGCVSLPSAEETDALLLALRMVARAYPRRGDR